MIDALRPPSTSIHYCIDVMETYDQITNQAPKKDDYYYDFESSMNYTTKNQISALWNSSMDAAFLLYCEFLLYCALWTQHFYYTLHNYNCMEINTFYTSYSRMSLLPQNSNYTNT